MNKKEVLNDSASSFFVHVFVNNFKKAASFPHNSSKKQYSAGDSNCRSFTSLRSKPNTGLHYDYRYVKKLYSCTVYLSFKTVFVNLFIVLCNCAFKKGLYFHYCVHKLYIFTARSGTSDEDIGTLRIFGQSKLCQIIARCYAHLSCISLSSSCFSLLTSHSLSPGIRGPLPFRVG